MKLSDNPKLIVVYAEDLLDAADKEATPLICVYETSLGFVKKRKIFFKPKDKVAPFYTMEGSSTFNVAEETKDLVDITRRIRDSFKATIETVLGDLDYEEIS